MQLLWYSIHVCKCLAHQIKKLPGQYFDSNNSSVNDISSENLLLIYYTNIGSCEYFCTKQIEIPHVDQCFK